MKKWFNSLTTFQKIWIILFPATILLCGIISNDTLINILIGLSGAIYVAVYSTGTRWSFLLAIIYVALYTIICLENRVMLDALQNIILIPLYIASFVRWGKQKTIPKNLTKKQTGFILGSSVIVLVALYYLSIALKGNYSFLDSLNTTCTLYAMVLGYFGASLNWVMWSINNVTSALTFGLALATPTGSIVVFAMKVAFCINGLIGWYTWYKAGKEK